MKTHFLDRSRRLVHALLLFAGLVHGAQVAQASGPHWVGGAAYFDTAAKGKPIVWAGGRLSYFLDRGELSGSVTNSQAATLVAGAAAVWSSVPTAGVSISRGGSLAEDVNGSNVTANSPAGTGAVLPADALPSATTKPLAIVFDADGSVIDDTYGVGASDAAHCTSTGVYSVVDNFATNGTIAHALILVNGLCATSSSEDGLLQYELVRAFGRVLGLDWSQVNEGMWPNETTAGLAGWPVMHPAERQCTGSMTTCMPNQMLLRFDDIASVNELYPVTSANAGSLSGKTLTRASTFRVEGTITFRNGQGMQGVNVVLTPLNPAANNQPDLRYTVSAVSGAFYRTSSPNAVTGLTDAQGNLYGRFGTDEPAVEGHYVFSGVPMPPGSTAASYQLSIEPVNPLYTGEASVGPYAGNQVVPSGAMKTVNLGTLTAGSTVTQNFLMADSADGVQTDDGLEAEPNSAGGNGEWIAKLVGYGHTGWFQFHARTNRTFTVEAAALEASGRGAETKAAVLIGLWNGTDALESAPALATTVPFNGATARKAASGGAASIEGAAGLSSLSAQTTGDGEIRVAYADMRGDGRPDFAYRARVLYADSVYPARLLLGGTNGGTIAIEGQGFREDSGVFVNGIAAQVTSVSPTEITAVAPASTTAGVVPVTVFDPETLGTATILDGLSYDSQGTDSIRLAPWTASQLSGPLPEGVPVPMMVQVVAGDGKTPAAHVQVTYSLGNGSAMLSNAAGVSCANPCIAITNQAGMAMVLVTPETAQASSVNAAIGNGTAPATARFNGLAAPKIAATNTLYVAAGAPQVSWLATAVVQNAGGPVQGAVVQWSAGSGASVATGSTQTNAAGLASTMVTTGSLPATGAVVYACDGTCGGNPYATFTIQVESLTGASLLAIRGVDQRLAAGSLATPVTLAVVDADNRPLAGAAVNVYQEMDEWQPACAPTGMCSAPQRLGAQATALVSDQNGLVTLTPMSAAGQAVTIHVLATLGTESTLLFEIVQHP